MKPSVLPGHPSIHPCTCRSLLPPVPLSLVPQFPPPHRGAVALTSLSGFGTLGASGVATAMGAGRGGRASACLRAKRLGVCARWWGAAGGVWGVRPGRQLPSVQMRAGSRADAAVASLPSPGTGWERRGTSPSPPAGTPLPPTRGPYSPPGHPPSPRMVRSTATSVFILQVRVPQPVTLPPPPLPTP